MGHFFIVHHTGLEIILSELLSAHTAHLGHAGIRVPQHAPFGVFHPPGLYRGHREVELSHLFRWYISISSCCPSYEPSHRHPFFPSGPVPLPHGAGNFLPSPSKASAGRQRPPGRQKDVPSRLVSSLNESGRHIIRPVQDSINKFSPGCSPTEYCTICRANSSIFASYMVFVLSSYKTINSWDCGSNLHIPRFVTTTISSMRTPNFPWKVDPWLYGDNNALFQRVPTHLVEPRVLMNFSSPRLCPRPCPKQPPYPWLAIYSLATASTSLYMASPAGQRL